MTASDPYQRTAAAVLARISLLLERIDAQLHSVRAARAAGDRFRDALLRAMVTDRWRGGALDRAGIHPPRHRAASVIEVERTIVVAAVPVPSGIRER